MTSANLKRIPPYESLDAWRGVAALWVVMLHACLPVIIRQYPHLAAQPIFAFSLYGQLGVPMFFVISGYCIANAAYNSHNRSDALRYYAFARLRRIYPPYLITTLLAFAVALFVFQLVRHGTIASSALAETDPLAQSGLYYLSALTLTQVPLNQKPILTVFWTLCYETSFYIVVGLALWATLRQKTANALLYSLHAVTIVSLLWLIAAPATVLYPFNLWAQFGLGVLLFHRVAEPKAHSVSILQIATLGLTVIFGIWHRGVGEVGHPANGFQFLFCAGFALLLSLLHRYDARFAANAVIRIFARVGIFSYSLYLTHLLCLGFVSQIGKKLPLTENTFWISFALQVALSVGFARLFFLFGEKPFLRSAKTSSEKNHTKEIGIESHSGGLIVDKSG